MGGSTKSVEIDFEKIFDNIKKYFSTLNNTEQYAWLGIGVGVLLIIVSLILW